MYGTDVALANTNGHEPSAEIRGDCHDLGSVPLEHLEHQICELASHIQAGTARFLELLGEFDRREAYHASGLGTCAHWVAWRCSLSPRAAREQVRVARALRELPLTFEAFSRGELSYSKARALTRVADEATEQDLLELARHATAAQLERITRTYERVSAQQARESIDRRYLSHYWDEDGSLCVSARLTADEGALFLRALDASRDALRERAWTEAQGGSAEPPYGEGGAAEPHETEAAGPGGGSAEPLRGDGDEKRITNADAFAAMAETVLSGGPKELSGGERYQLVVHADAGALAQRDGGTAAIEDGPSLSFESLRRLGCDASLVSMLERDGHPLSVGRKARVIPPAIRRALSARDRGCRFPGCENHRFTDAHHIEHWADGGKTSVDNLVLLCRRHHRLLHEGGFSIERDAAGDLRFRAPGGWVIPNSPPLADDSEATPNGDGTLRSDSTRAGLAIDDRTAWSGTGERMNLDLCILAVCTAKERAAARSAAPQSDQ